MTEQPPENTTHTFSHLTAEDMVALKVIKNNSDWLRAVSCTLARRGVAFREEDPERASEILESLAPLPYFRAGQFLFDLLEWEDFMFDGPPPPILNTALDAHALHRLASLLKTAQTYLDSGQFKTDSADQFRDYFHVGMTNLILDDRQFPALKASFYLYHDVVLGLYTSALESVPPPPPEPPLPPPGTRVCINFKGHKENKKLDPQFKVLWHNQGQQYLGPIFSPLEEPLQLMQLGDPKGVTKLCFASSGMRINFPKNKPVEKVTLTVNNYSGPELHFKAYLEENALEEYDFTLPIEDVVKMVEFSTSPLTAIEISGGGESSLVEICYTTT